MTDSLLPPSPPSTGEKVIAILVSLGIPGSGHLMTERPGAGLLFLVAAIFAALMAPALWLVVGVVSAMSVHSGLADRRQRWEAFHADSEAALGAPTVPAIAAPDPTSDLRLALAADLASMLDEGGDAGDAVRYRQANSAENLSEVLAQMAAARKNREVTRQQVREVRANLAVNLALYGSSSDDDEVVAAWASATRRGHATSDDLSRVRGALHVYPR